MVGGNAVYSGTTSVTINNHACQKWSSQSPNKHGYIDSYFSVTNGDASPGYAGASNYCRDPSGGNLKPEGFAWCYVASGKTRWERCDIPRCPATTTNAATTAPVRRPAPPRTAATSANDCYTMVGGNAVYSGTTSVTINNHACQKWSSQSPNKHGYIDSYFSVTNGDASPGYAGASNYCRDPSGGNLKPEGFAWCYVASGKTRWERCDIPRCPATTTNAATTAPVPGAISIASTISVALIMGNKLTPATPSPMLAVTSTVSTPLIALTALCGHHSLPNKHGYIDSYFSVTNGDASPGYAGASNYCRDPSGGDLKPEGFAWCYVASGKTRWERCDIPRCPATTTNAATTSPAPPRTAAVTTTVAATAAASANECYTMVGGNAVYSGTTSVTINNRACQKWSSQSPNKHGYIDSYFSITNGDAGPGYAGASNYCRDPSGGNLKPEGFAWCYVASGKTRWERCDIPRCPATTTNAATTAGPAAA
ncbi:plasminogen-like [Haliotis rubra]|uniref:plasminogen-like n=1 Tax=Haliotis rubra TaxID=36100 RepID=UPI001EE5875E|nr:plasminogen-like [Haliotis rubra]